MGKLSHSEEVAALMSKGMKIVISDQWCVWAHAPRKVSEAMGTSFIAALPAANDLIDYLAKGGELVRARSI